MKYQQTQQEIRKNQAEQSISPQAEQSISPKWWEDKWWLDSYTKNVLTEWSIRNKNINEKYAKKQQERDKKFEERAQSREKQYTKDSKAMFKVEDYIFDENLCFCWRFSRIISRH